MEAPGEQWWMSTESPPLLTGSSVLPCFHLIHCSEAGSSVRCVLVAQVVSGSDGEEQKLAHEIFKVNLLSVLWRVEEIQDS